MKTFYLSFVSDDGVFLGAMLADGDDELAACQETIRRGCNPLTDGINGEVLAIEVPPEAFAEHEWIKTAERWRLYRRQDLGDVMSIGDLKRKAKS